MTLTDAIVECRLITFSYDGYMRTVEPHCYGVDVKDHLALRAYQISGGSESGEYIGWKLFHVNEMYDVTILAQQFSGARLQYKRGDRAFSNIYAEL